MSTTSTTYVHLAPNPKSAYKQLFVKVTRIRARVLYGLCAGEGPRTPQQIAADYKLPVEAVVEAIAYCESNPPELAADVAREETLSQAAGISASNYKKHGKPKLLTAQELARLRRA